jgi:hypothetical protein
MSNRYMSNSSIATCHNRTGAGPYDATLFGQQILPFVDMTVKGWVWCECSQHRLETANTEQCTASLSLTMACLHADQGENNMPGRKGNSAADEGYSCSQRVLIEGWREIWSKIPGTTDPRAPFGIVTLASSGSEGGPNMGAMRQAREYHQPSASCPCQHIACRC